MKYAVKVKPYTWYQKKSDGTLIFVTEVKHGNVTYRDEGRDYLYKMDIATFKSIYCMAHRTTSIFNRF